MHCPKCQANVPNGAHECLECGMPLRENPPSWSPLRTAYLIAALGAAMFCAGALMMINAGGKANPAPATKIIESSNGGRLASNSTSSAPVTNASLALSDPNAQRTGSILGPAPAQTGTTDDAGPADTTATNQALPANAFDQYMDRIKAPGQAVDDAMDSIDRIVLAKDKGNAPLSTAEDQEMGDDISRLQTARTAFRSFQPDPDFVHIRDLTVQTIDATMDVADRFRMYMNAGQTTEDEVMKSDAQRIVSLKQQVAAEMERLRAKYP